MQTPAVLTFLHMLAAAGGLRLASQYDVFERMQVREEGRGGEGGAGERGGGAGSSRGHPAWKHNVTMQVRARGGECMLGEQYRPLTA